MTDSLGGVNVFGSHLMISKWSMFRSFALCAYCRSLASEYFLSCCILDGGGVSISSSDDMGWYYFCSSHAVRSFEC